MNKSYPSIQGCSQRKRVKGEIIAIKLAILGSAVWDFFKKCSTSQCFSNQCAYELTGILLKMKILLYQLQDQARESAFPSFSQTNIQPRPHFEQQQTVSSLGTFLSFHFLLQKTERIINFLLCPHEKIVVMTKLKNYDLENLQGISEII